jgi:opacity protein-like surface antigen
MLLMGRLGRLVVCAAALTIAGAAAHAADMPGYPSEPLPFPTHETPALVEQLSSGWYLRGDLGYRFQLFDSASDVVNDYINSKMADPFVAGVGAGYKFKWFRFDVTGDYGGPSSFSGATDNGNSVSAKVDTYTVMFNGYLDLGTWSGFTPYVGAGIGKSRMEIHNFVTTPAPTNPVSAKYMWNIAWSAMVGVSYDLSNNLLIDVGYRHVDMGDIKSGPSDNPFTIKHVTGDEVRIGLRYLID